MAVVDRVRRWEAKKSRTRCNKCLKSLRRFVTSGGNQTCFAWVGSRKIVEHDASSVSQSIFSCFVVLGGERDSDRRTGDGRFGQAKLEGRPDLIFSPWYI